MPPTIAETIKATNTRIESATRLHQFVSLARCIALGRGQHGRALLAAQEARLKGLDAILGSAHRVYELPPDVADRQKAAILAGGSQVGDWGEQLAAYQALANAFIESLRNFGAFDAMLPSMRQVPFRVRVGATTLGSTGGVVPQASVKPVSRLSLTGGTLDETKAVAIIVITEELTKFGGAAAGNLFAVELSNAVAVATDTEFVSILTSGATSFTATGGTAEHVRNDLRIALAQLSVSVRSQLFLITTPAIAKTLSVLHTNAGDAAFEGMTYKGGQIAGITVVVSDGVSSGNMILVDASTIAAASEAVTLSSSNQASLQLNDAPDSPPVAATLLTSLWQMNMVGLKAERFFGAEKLTTNGVVVVTGAGYSGDSPGP